MSEPYPITGGAVKVCWPYGKPVEMGRRWDVTSPILRKSTLFDDGVHETLEIIEQSNGTFGILEHCLDWHGRDYKSLEEAHKAASDILKAKDAALPKDQRQA
jgi:hypothetical protein